jgi:hypothetical protein
MMQVSRIKYLRRELEEYRSLLAQFPEGGNWQTQAVRLRWERTADQLAKELWEISKIIADITDPELRLIFQLRYFHGYPWARVAKELPTTLSPNGARMKHDRYLKKLYSQSGEGSIALLSCHNS